MIGLTYEELKLLSPCSESFFRVTAAMGGADKWKGTKIDASAAKAAGCTFEDIVWAASALAKSNKAVDRKLRMWMADCAARVLHIYEETETSDAPRTAIIASRQLANGEIDDAASAAARAAAMAASMAAARAAAMAVAWAVARDAARDAAWVAAWDAAWDAARAVEEQWQFARLIEWMSDNEPSPIDLPERV